MAWILEEGYGFSPFNESSFSPTASLIDNEMLNGGEYSHEEGGEFNSFPQVCNRSFFGDSSHQDNVTHQGNPNHHDNPSHHDNIQSHHDNLNHHDNNPSHHDNTIHSGHFMVSNLNDDDVDDVPDLKEAVVVVTAAGTSSVKTETVERDRGVEDVRMYGASGYDFANATRQLQDTYMFGTLYSSVNEIAIDASLVKMFNHMKLAYR